ncbi:hypothetical protein WJX74_010061 [Apatococcus lobatus]|uniref:Uncharacterized protein n=1 Tax=Apatococcus lobatus TaxID=904363 RepID=A0AAW1QV50_9CHLO
MSTLRPEVISQNFCLRHGEDLEQQRLDTSLEIPYFGGDDQVSVQEQVTAGDVLVIPAGVAHKQVKSSGGFTMVGAYPVGAPHWDCLEDAPLQQYWQRAS